MWGTWLPCLGGIPSKKSSQQRSTHTLSINQSHDVLKAYCPQCMLSVIDSLLVVIFYNLHGTSADGGLCTRSYSHHSITLLSSHCTAMPLR